MIWLSVICTILILIVLHYFGDVLSNILGRYIDYFQASSKPQNEREESKTLHSNDFETPTNRNISSPSVFHKQDGILKSTVSVSEEVSSTSPKSCYSNSQVASSQKEDGEKINEVPCSDILSRFQNGIYRNKSLQVKTTQPDVKRYKPQSFGLFANLNSLGTQQIKTKSVFTNSSKNENKIVSSDDIHCKNSEECFSSTQLVSKHQDDGKKDQACAFLDIQKKNSKERCRVPEFLSQEREEREDKDHPFKDVYKKEIGGHSNNFQAVSRQRDLAKDNELHSQEDRYKNFEGSCSNYQTQSKQQNEENGNKSLVFKNVHVKNIGDCLNDTQTVPTIWHLENDESLGTNLELNSSNSPLFAEQDYDTQEDQMLPENWILNTNTKLPGVMIGDFSSSLLKGTYSKTVSKEQEKHTAIKLKDIRNKNVEKDSHLESPEQFDREEDEAVSCEKIHQKNIEGNLITPQTFIVQQDDERDINKVIQNENLQENSNPLQTKQQDGGTTEDSSSKDVHKQNNERYSNKIKADSNQMNSGMKEKELLSKPFHFRNTKRYFYNSRPVSKQQKIKTRYRSSTHKTRAYREQDHKHKARQSRVIENKNLRESSPDFAQTEQQDDGTEVKDLPSKDVLSDDNEGYLNETGAGSNQEGQGMKDEGLTPECTRNRNTSRYFYNSKSVSKQQRAKIRTFASKARDDQNGVGSFMCVLFENQLYTDVTFFSKGNRALLSAHRAVLAAKCEYFKDLLFGDLAKDSDGMQMDLEIREVPFCIFSNIVKWFYTGYIEFSDDYTVLETYQAAKNFKIQQLVKKCRNYIDSMEINEHNVFSFLQLCDTLQVNRLKKRCFKYIEKNTLTVINSTEFEKSPFNAVREICQLQRLSLKSEADILDAVLRWLKARPKLERNAAKDLERSLLKCVRFLSLSTKEFSNIIAKNASLLTAEESLNILVYLNNPTPEGLEALPEWCNKSQRTLLVSNQEKKDPGIAKNLPSEHTNGGKIKIKLKPPDVAQDFSELSSILHMTCTKGMHQITSVKFSFQDVESDDCVLADLKIIVNVLPNGPQFLRFYSMRQSEVTFDFERAVAVREGQVLVMEVKATPRQSCKFFQFDKWFNDPKSDFGCFFVSKPLEGKLYFISEIAYEPLAPRLNIASRPILRSKDV